MSMKEWIDLLLDVDVDVSSGRVFSGWDTSDAKRMARVKFVQTALLTANFRAGIDHEKGFVWNSGSFLPIFDSCSNLRCCALQAWWCFRFRYS